MLTKIDRHVKKVNNRLKMIVLFICIILGATTLIWLLIDKTISLIQKLEILWLIIALIYILLYFHNYTIWIMRHRENVFISDIFKLINNDKDDVLNDILMKYNNSRVDHEQIYVQLTKEMHIEANK